MVEGYVHPILQLFLLPLQDFLSLHGLDLALMIMGLSLYFPMEIIMLEGQVVTSAMDQSGVSVG